MKTKDVNYSGRVIGDKGVYQLSIVREIEYPGKDETRLTYLPGIYISGEELDEEFVQAILETRLEKLNNEL